MKIYKFKAGKNYKLTGKKIKVHRRNQKFTRKNIQARKNKKYIKFIDGKNIYH